MCKPGSACCGCGTASSGIGAAAAFVVTAVAVSTTAALISDILTAALITVFSIAGAGSIMLVVILRRTRGVVNRPLPASRPRARVLPARHRARPVAVTGARPAVPARQPLAIQAPWPAREWAAAPPGSSGPAMVRRQVRVPSAVPAAPAPEAALPGPR